MSKVFALAFLLAQVALIASEKAGVCPSSSESAFGACVITCGADEDCEGTKKCCNNGCGAWCSEATCPSDQTRVDCPSSLCTYVGCPGKERKSVQCSVDFCSQCKVNFLNITTGDAVDCGPVETMCSRIRAANNKHLFGRYIPECDENGAFKRVQCHEGYCFCVDKRGVPDMSTKVRGGTPKCPEKTLCQQQVEQAMKLPPIGRFVPKCKPDGSFKEIQCHASTGQCWCVDTYGREWFGTRSRGNTLECTKSVCPAGVTQLKCDPMICYAASCPGFKDVVCRVNPCGKCQPEFLDKYNRPVKCLTACQSLRNGALGVGEPGSNQARPLVGRYVPQCTNDGQFQQIQCYGSTGYCWCVDRNGSPVLGSIVRGKPHCNSSAVGVCPRGKPMFTCLRDFCKWKTCPAYPNAKCRVNPCGTCKAEFVDASGNVIKDSDCVKGKTLCQQKRAQALQTGHGGLQPVGRFVPECDGAGNFKSMQCWGSVGYCWCVDAAGNEVHGSRVRGLPDCSKQPVKPVNNGYCPLKQPRSRQSRSAPSCHLASKCSMDSHCQGGSKCCNGTSCGTTCQKPIVTACPNGRPFLLCLHMCNFAKCPGNPKAQCFSDPCNMCKIEFKDTNGNKVDCSKGLTPCQLRRQQAMGLLGAFRPECDSKGNYKFVQQHEGYYWCVDSNGKEISGTKKRFSKPTCPNTGVSSLTLCQLQSQKVSGGRTMVGRYVPQCESDGSFKQVQCHPSTGYCWCVNKTTGFIFRDTQIRGQPNCNKVCSPVMCRMYCEYGFVKDQFGCEICRCADVPVKPGFCPAVKPSSDRCNDTCKQDNDCPGSNKCCSNGCGLSCTSAVLKEKRGVCPRRPVDHVGMCMNKCGDDADCNGDKKCCSNGCGRECSAPIRQACPYGEPLVMCLVNPCNMASCPANPKAVCRPRYCGSCKAEFFDQDNKIVDCKKGLTLCQSMYLKLTSKGPMIVAYVPQCDKNGAFKAMQCSGSTGYCWCVDTETGKKISNTDRGPTEARPSCNATTPVGPACLKNSKRFSLCQGSLCVSTNCTRNPRARCVVPMGTCEGQCQAKFYDYDGSEVQCLTECQQKALDATQKGLLGAYKPTCNTDGTYTLIQCHPSTGYCWCSSPDGKEWPGTRARGSPKCLRARSGLDVTKVHVKLTFKNDFETINDSLADFITVLKAQLSPKLRLKEKQITELSVTEGSIIVQFDVVPVEGGRDIADFAEHVENEVRRQDFVITYAGMKFVVSPQLVQAAANYKSDDETPEKEGLTSTHIALICVFAALAIVIVGVIVVVVKKKRGRARSDTDTAGFVYRDGRAESYSAVSTT